jgi:hypothetical protein
MEKPSLKTSLQDAPPPTLEQVLLSLRRWNRIIADARCDDACKNSEDSDECDECRARILEIFSNFNGFTIPALELFTNDDHHVYIGMESDAPTAKPEFFIISKSNDTPLNIVKPGVISRYVAAYHEPPPAPGASEELTKAEALRRMSNWLNNYTSWVNSMYKMEYPLFHAWYVPEIDMAGNDMEHKVVLGLIVSEVQNRTELIFYTTGNDAQHFFDLVRPVPPFKSGELDDYTLLMTALAGV